ncbi:MAG: hypothetical protein NT052_00810 [Candidatus Shapirobacteria bacterium]|nr:hypothetical protein [Candidatus Shapirobacteria bacterium]
MISPTQILLIVVVSALSVVLVIIGVQVFYLFREFRRSVEKVNKVLDDVGTVSSAITKPIASLSNSLGNFSGMAGIFSWLLSLKKKKERDNNE